MPVDLDRLARTPPEEKLLRAGSILFRVYFREAEHAGPWNRFRRWGPHPDCRFDHHEGPDPHDQDRRILYAAELPHIALVEVFDAARTIHRTRDAPALAQFVLVKDLLLLDLSNDWIHRAGGKPAEILTGDREVSRQWARAIWTAYGKVEGLFYRSVLSPAHFNVALFERAEHAIPGDVMCDVLLTHAGIKSIVERTANDFGLDLV